ncbi:1-acyl-sn-glycerol-3-phosphate acyltransferase [Thermolongibacillus altinsuensis]|uniref:1-acyl-sn-glycerol-3-phosphate acyltransferase n=3 Tax=Bacillales TaxID=1385 RepID=A0A4R1Q9W6_9BACL|nr:1-acyl-sn-glycerol-3-phosphate acyltransferase [Thermolongibacillus altinsuensis]
MMYHIVAKILYFIIKLFRLLEVRGKENIPKNKNYVVTCSHRGWVDVIMLAMSLYPTQVHYMAKKELFNSRLIGTFLKYLNAFPVNRQNPGPSTLKIPMKLLKENKIVGIFPSGTRTNEEVPLKRGAVTIAIKANVPILPASYHGPTNLKEILIGKKATVILGEPLYFDKQKEEMDKDELLSYSLKLLENKMKNLEKTFIK